MRGRLLLACLAAVCLPGCVCRLELPETTIGVADAELRVEVAASSHARACGLAYRDTLGADSGMLFVLPEPTDLTFWMANTRIPLAIAFLDQDSRVISIQRAEPARRRSRYRAPSPALYVIETNANWFERHGIDTGDRFSITLPAAMPDR